MKFRLAPILPALLIAAIPFASSHAQIAATAQQHARELKQSIAANRAKLMKYQWIQTTQVNLKGQTKKDSTDSCRYGSDGKVVKTPVGPPPLPPNIPQSGIKGRIARKKMAEMQDYTTRLKSLISHYAPPDPDMIQTAVQNGGVNMQSNAGIATLTFTNYYKPGDSVSFALDTATKKLVSYNVNTYLDDPKKDIVTLANQFATLPDGTNYVQQTTLNATSKQLQIITTNSNYSRITP
jgi:hypothetical protein